MSKAADRLKALQQRSASYAAPAATPEAQAEQAPSSADDLADARAYFGVEPLEQLARGRSVERIPVGFIAPDMRPEDRQPRLLPLPDELMTKRASLPVYASLVNELLELGRSLQERQLQPIIVYPGSSDLYPAARYLILVGHRRWTAALFVGMETLQAVVVDPPTPDERVIAQYVENEARADFSDIERAWSLLQMKQALGDVSWEAVEERFHMSRSRRQDLLRLTVFTSEQQTQLAQLRLSETQVRPLHTAVRNDELPLEQVDKVLARLSTLAFRESEEATQPAVDGPTIARLVAKAKREESAPDNERTAQWAQALLDQLSRTKRSLRSAKRRVATAGSVEFAQLLASIREITALLAEIEGELLADK